MEAASYWTGVAAVVLGALAGAAGILAWYFAIKVGDVKDEEMERFKEESRIQVAAAGASAARALAEGSAANERSINLALDVEKQRERAANAENELLELQNRLAWRAVTVDQAKAAAEKLSPFKGEEITVIITPSDEEADRFGNQLIGIFKAAGLRVTPGWGAVFGGAVSGVTAECGEKRVRLLAAIAEALGSTGILKERLVADRSMDPAELTLRVWPKKT